MKLIRLPVNDCIQYVVCTTRMNDLDEACMITATVRVLLQAGFGNVSAMKSSVWWWLEEPSSHEHCSQMPIGFSSAIIKRERGDNERLLWLNLHQQVLL